VLHCDRHRYETVPWNDCDAGCCLMRWMLADPRNRLECWNAVNHCPGLDRLLTRSGLDIVLVWLFSSHFWVSSVLQSSLHMSHSGCTPFHPCLHKYGENDAAFVWGALRHSRYDRWVWDETFGGVSVGDVCLAATYI
jgi:hypothetical protein